MTRLIKGYGINGDDIDWVLDANVVLYNHIQSFPADSEPKDQLDSFMAAGTDPDSDIDEMFDVFCESYENRSTGAYGFDGIACDVVDQLAFDGKNMLRTEKSFFYVELDDALDAGITKDVLEAKLQEHFWPLCRNNPVIGYQEIPFDD